MSFYNYTQARIMLQQKKTKQARRALEVALQLTPDYEPAKELLEWVEIFERLQGGFGAFFERAQTRDRSARVRLQGKLSTPDPTLAQVLPLYTKDALTGMARIVLWWGGWSALRKAELIAELVSGLQNRANLQKIVADLGEKEQSALRHVLMGRGWMRWEDFDAAYDNDLEESRHWNFHVPETVMGRLRVRGLLVETTVDGELRVAIPVDLRAKLNEVLR